MQVLIVDDSVTIRKLLKLILEENRHQVIEAEDGFQALEYIESKKPDLIIMDVELPKLNGYETVAKLRSLSKNKVTTIEDWVPVIFLSGLNDEASLAKGIEVGGDDYLFKPFSTSVFNAKLKAMERIYQMKKSLIEQKELLKNMHHELLEEQMVAKNVYDNIIQNGVIQKQDFIKTYVSSKNVFNGDLALIAQSPSDNYYMIIGDFTGHGLSAALGIIPAAEVFLKLTTQGYTLEQLLIELNDKLHNILPPNIFCAAAVVEVNLTHGQLSVWNGWAPPVLCFSTEGKLKNRFDSTNMPLGSLKKSKFNYRLACTEILPGDRIYIYSDGFIEAKNSCGNMYSIERLDSIIVKSIQAATDPISAIVEDLLAYRGDLPQQDDLTLIEILVQPPLKPR